MDKKYNPLNPTDNNEKPLDPRQALDPVMQALRKRRKERLQRATHGDAPPIFPDPMDAEMNEYREKPKGPDPEGKDKNKPVFNMDMVKKQKENISKGKCATCGGGVGEFKDAISEKDYGITGMCQKCQDRFEQMGEALESKAQAPKLVWPGVYRFMPQKTRDSLERSRQIMMQDVDRKMFPHTRTVARMTKGMSPERVRVFNRAMSKKSSARGEWRTPETAVKLAQRIADSILYERDERTRTGDQPEGLVKRPKIGGGPVSHLRTLKRSGGLTGSDAYRRRSSHATLTRTQPHRFIEKMSSLVAAWRNKETGQGRQVVKNLAVAPRRGRQARKQFLSRQAEKGKK